MVKALAREIELRKHFLDSQQIDSIYFGGGTPSVLDEKELQLLLDAIYTNYHVADHPEITLEANPDDISPLHLAEWKSMGINRLSIGVQAFQDKLLQEWNRSHNAIQSQVSIRLAQDAGFENITADLIYGSTLLSDDDWQYNIRMLTEMGIPHISAYALTVEEKTALHYQVEKGKTPAPDEEQAARQYAQLQQQLEEAGYEQYEVSNFAKPGYRSKHNSSYWSGVHYLGIGPSAHSYNGTSRQWNIAHNVQYLESIKQGKLPLETEVLTPAQQYNEIVMTGLRTAEGIDLERIKAIDTSFVDFLEQTAKPFQEQQQLYLTESGNLALYHAFYFLADGIASALFYVT